MREKKNIDLTIGDSVREKKIIEDLIKDKSGLLYSTELLISIILLVFILGIISNLSDDLNEKVLSEEEFSSLEDISIKTCDYLLNNPGNPENWEENENLNNGIVSSNIIPGLAIKNKKIENNQFYSKSSNDEKVITNTISYNKLIKIKNNYNQLITTNLFNNSFKSSIAIYPLNNKIRPITMGYGFDNNFGDENNEEGNIIVVNRTVKCDFYSNFVVYNFNDYELFRDDYKRDEICNHDTNPNLTNHTSDIRTFWLCKNFRVYKKSLEEYDFYLLSDESIKNSNSYWILESLNRTNNNKERLNQEIIDLNPFFREDLENSSNEIYSIHFNTPKNNINDFKTVLVAIPKNMTNNLIANDELKYDYFKSQEVNFLLKMRYK
ncbi:hypothetical protein [Methanobrevibacter olleyae]|uniref:Uncharacterized protein n=1 Tax=Methanobrevibacter olleyae TaxID=294671 RepID=A0A126R1B9_METOL|nr:hypothetical protein [Methanobrevibacter olleyae]AMK16180.1 hypothetical protein YLM1_1625 [Methanobrevibacter olleyae]SFL52661.1 hypothetical protein SAMN02910297_01130 [Methanobrevibacter olleyae]